MLNQRARGIGFYRTAYYLPSLVPAVASTLLWLVLLDPRLGVVNQLLMAASLAVTAPIIALFFVLQRYFTEGVTLTGLRG